MRKIDRDLGIFTFNGRSSKDFDIVVEKLPSLDRPQRQYDVYHVPGRNGDVVEQYNAYDDITITYEVWFADNDIDSMNAQMLARQISAWLYTSTGYCKLEDDFEPDIYRLGYFVGDLAIENLLTAYGRAKISFVCRPERYFKPNDWINSPSYIYNSHSFEAKPLIKVEGSGDVSFAIQGQTVQINDLVDYVYLNCDTQDCYRQSSENRNNLMIGNFPVLKVGENHITTNNCTLQIQPNFWTL
jgi:predicted phage tail component-like protein